MKDWNFANIGTKPLPEPMQTYCQLDAKEQLLQDSFYQIRIMPEFGFELLKLIAHDNLMITILVNGHDMVKLT